MHSYRVTHILGYTKAMVTVLRLQAPMNRMIQIFENTVGSKHWPH